MDSLVSQEDNRDIMGYLISLEAPTHLVAIHLRYHDVQQDQVGEGGASRHPQRPDAMVATFIL